jgi:hypothetical protein
MFLQHFFKVFFRPVRIGATQEGGDIFAVCRPLLLCVIELLFIPAFGGLDDFSSERDVIAQQRCQLLARVLTVIRLDRIADIILIFQQAFGNGITVRQICQRADDVVACVGDMFFPQFSHRHPYINSGCILSRGRGLAWRSERGLK